MGGGTIILPWPPKELSPNARVNWRRLRGNGSLGETYKRTAWALAKEAKLALPPGDTWVSLNITFCPPDRRRRDLDNMFSSIKAGLDGICKAGGFDDSRFGTVTLTTGEPVKNGKVAVRIEG
jgi:crossover junction endodeoxyribonuclease RusA